jgi:hypothetical protein
MTVNISDINQAYIKQRAMVKLPRTLIMGTMAMRDMGETYLIRKQNEKDKDYKDRLENAVLKNFFAQTIDYLAGQVFQKPIDYIKEYRESSAETDFFTIFKEDVDLSGNNLSTFSLELFKNGIIDGVTFVLVDYNNVTAVADDNGNLFYKLPTGELAPKTKQADIDNKWRSYFVKILASQVLDAWIVIENGQKVLKHFRYEEFIERPKDERGIEREKITRIRAFWPGRWELWEKSSLNNNNLESEALIASGKTSLDYIPIFAFMPGSDLESAITAIPPLADLAETNKLHWNSLSHHNYLMKFVRGPAWFGVNIEKPENEEFKFGPSSMVLAYATMGSGVSPSLNSVGVDPSSVAASQTDLKGLEDTMERYGLQIALSPAGYTTATQVATMANASDSQLKSWVVQLQDTLENCLKAVAKYVGQDDGPPLFVNTEFRESFDSNKASILQSLKDGGNLTRFTLLSELQKMGGISDEIDIKEEDDILTKIEEDNKPQFDILNNIPFDESNSVDNPLVKKEKPSSAKE